MLMDTDYGLRMFDLVYIIPGCFNLSLRDFCFVLVLAFALYLSIAFPYHIFSLVELFSPSSVVFSWRFAFSGYILSGQGLCGSFFSSTTLITTSSFLQRSNEACWRDIVCSGLHYSGSGRVGCICDGCLFRWGCRVEDMRRLLASMQASSYEIYHMR
jgi:hypothetical protein